MIDGTILEKIKAGATVRVFEKISAKGAVPAGRQGSPPAGRAGASGGKEGDKERLSQFEGLVLARKHGSEPGASFTVRATIAGVGVEKVYPIHSPVIAKVEVLSSPRKVHRAKLYYLRHLTKKEIRQQTAVTAEKNAN